MAEITLANPGYLWVLLFIPLLVAIHFLTLRQSRAAVIKFSNFEAIERVAKGDVLGSPYRGLLKNKNMGLLVLRALIYCLLIFAVAGTTLWYEGTSSSFDYVVAIDASSSMLADDFKPTRFDAAKEAAAKFVDFIPKDAKIGIVTFATTSRIELKPASNLGEVKEFIGRIGMHQSGGTAIGDAIITSTNLFDSKKTKAVILLTDGQSNVGIDPDVAVEYAKQNEITIHSIGVATKEGGNVSNLNIVSKIDEELLEKASKETGGKFFIVDNIESLDVAFRQIASSTEKLLSFDISGVLLVSVVILLGLEWALINTLYKSIP